MYREMLSCMCALVLLMQTMQVAGAPAPSPARRGSKLTMHLNDLAGVDDAGSEVLSRQRRHAHTAVAPEHVQQPAESDDGDDVVSSRRRRSAAFFLSAAIKMCDVYPYMCTAIEVTDGESDAKVKIIIRDE